MQDQGVFPLCLREVQMTLLRRQVTTATPFRIRRDSRARSCSFLANLANRSQLSHRLPCFGADVWSQQCSVLRIWCCSRIQKLEQLALNDYGHVSSLNATRVNNPLQAAVAQSVKGHVSLCRLSQDIKVNDTLADGANKRRKCWTSMLCLHSARSSVLVHHLSRTRTPVLSS